MEKINLEITSRELNLLEVAMEQICQNLFDEDLPFDAEKDLLEKIYEVSSSDKFKRLPLRRMQRDSMVRRSYKEGGSLDFSKIVLC